MSTAPGAVHLKISLVVQLPAWHKLGEASTGSLPVNGAAPPFAQQALSGEALTLVIPSIGFHHHFLLSHLSVWALRHEMGFRTLCIVLLMQPPTST
jgi:hypothetical protein